MIPAEYGGAGLGLTEASIIMEEINRNGGNAAACHGQMYNMGTLLRHGSLEQKKRYLPKIACGELRLQAMAVTETASGTDTTKIQTAAVKKKRSLCSQWTKGMDLACAAFRFDDSSRTYYAVESSEEKIGRHVDLSRRSAQCRQQTAYRPAFTEHGQS